MNVTGFDARNGPIHMTAKELREKLAEVVAEARVHDVVIDCILLHTSQMKWLKFEQFQKWDEPLNLKLILDIPIITTDEWELPYCVKCGKCHEHN